MCTVHTQRLLCMEPFTQAKISRLSTDWVWDSVFSLGHPRTKWAMLSLARVGLSMARIPLCMEPFTLNTEFESSSAVWNTGLWSGSIADSWYIWNNDDTELIQVWSRLNYIEFGLQLTVTVWVKPKQFLSCKRSLGEKSFQDDRPFSFFPAVG